MAKPGGLFIVSKEAGVSLVNRHKLVWANLSRWIAPDCVGKMQQIARVQRSARDPLVRPRILTAQPSLTARAVRDRFVPDPYPTGCTLVCLRELQTNRVLAALELF